MNRIDLLHAIEHGAPFRNIYLDVVDSSRDAATNRGTLKIAVPDLLVKAMRGNMEQRPAVFLVVVPPELKAKLESPIILPGDIVTPGVNP